MPGSPSKRACSISAVAVSYTLFSYSCFTGARMTTNATARRRGRAEAPDLEQHKGVGVLVAQVAQCGAQQRRFRGEEVHPRAQRALHQPLPLARRQQEYHLQTQSFHTLMWNWPKHALVHSTEHFLGITSVLLQDMLRRVGVKLTCSAEATVPRGPRQDAPCR